MRYSEAKQWIPPYHKLKTGVKRHNKLILLTPLFYLRLILRLIRVIQGVRELGNTGICMNKYNNVWVPNVG